MNGIEQILITRMTTFIKYTVAGLCFIALLAPAYNMTNIVEVHEVYGGIFKNQTAAEKFLKEKYQVGLNKKGKIQNFADK